MCIPRWLDKKKLDLPVVTISNIMEGWACQIRIWILACKTPTVIPWSRRKTKQAGGYGSALKDDYRYFYGAHFGMDGRGEAIAREDNYCEIDPSTVDKIWNSCIAIPL